MRLLIGALAAVATVLAPDAALLAQSGPTRPSSPTISVPRVISVGGAFRPADGQPPNRVEVVTLSIYAEETGGTPLWQETQSVSIDPSGKYTLLLGATEVEGVPLDVFASGEARWLAIAWERPGEVEGPRTRLTSVPYALHASHADTLGGKPASAYMLAPAAGTKAATDAAAPAAIAEPAAVNPGTVNYLAKYVTSANVDDSALYETGGKVGINTSAPLDVLHARFTNTTGTMTGLAVQNLGSTASSYSGMLFYDHTGALGQFQGFNNSTHEYRINNVASGGSINFMTGGTSRFLITPSSGILLGTTTPEPAFLLPNRLTVHNATGVNGILARKTVSATFEAAIHARSGPGITGVLIKALMDRADNTDTGGNIAILGSNPTTGGIGVYGEGGSGGNAGYFYGNVYVSGTVTKGGGAFQIDHPLDPGNKYLQHSFVESSDMMNVYNGNVTLDANGQAWVTLPAWFEALNRDFRYQLTAVGAPGPNLFIADEISANRFRIAGGTANGRVSWQVTGIRHDAWADANRIVVELEKAEAERGRYLHPEIRGLSRDLGIPGARTVVIAKGETPEP